MFIRLFEILETIIEHSIQVSLPKVQRTMIGLNWSICLGDFEKNLRHFRNIWKTKLRWQVSYFVLLGIVSLTIVFVCLFVCLFVWSLSTHSRIFTHRDVDYCVLYRSILFSVLGWCGDLNFTSIVKFMKFGNMGKW